MFKFNKSMLCMAIICIAAIIVIFIVYDHYLYESVETGKTSGSELITDSPENESDDVATRQTIIISGSAYDTDLVNAVKEFNAANENYEVVVKEYDTDRLLTEIASGGGPDLLPVSYIGLEECAKKEIVEDLDLWLEQSLKLSEDMLNEKVLELFTLNDRLVCIPPTFAVQTIFGRKSELGEEPGWTDEEFLDFVDRHSGKTILEGVMRGDSGQILMLTMWDAKKGRMD